MKNRLSLAKEGHAFSCISKRLKKVPKTRLYLSKRQHNPQRTHLPPAVPAKRELPWDSRWRRCSVAKQPKQLLRTLISCVLLPALTLHISDTQSQHQGALLLRQHSAFTNVHTTQYPLASAGQDHTTAALGQVTP